MNRSKALARFAFMHCIASSLCFWINAIALETLDSIVNKTYFASKDSCDDVDDSEADNHTVWNDLRRGDNGYQRKTNRSEWEGPAGRPAG